MYLIVDSGANKTDYLVADTTGVLFQFRNQGINISYTDDQLIKNSLYEFMSAFTQKIDVLPEYVFYYGAGCGVQENNDRMFFLLQSIFPEAKIAVYSDLLASCHAMCEDDPGWVAILGAGSSSCYYNGKTIETMAPSLGYLLGDEGSGTDLGKRFITAYLSMNLPTEIKTDFENFYEMGKDMIMERIYRKPFPNRFFASLAPYLSEHLSCSFVENLCFSSFTDFFKKQKDYLQKCHYPCDEIFMTGSIAYYFKELISMAAKENKIEIKKIEAGPADHLVNYYHKRMK